jgi:hypothetical protein
VNKNSLEKLLWSIALPGFGQLLNRKYIKGILLIVLEIIVNIQSNFNEAILSSFKGNTHTSINEIDFQWLMFYPCLYFFSMWDAIKDANEGVKSSPLLFLPFVFSAYFVTVGLIYSSEVTIFHVFLGPVFLPMLCVIPGIITGLIVKKLVK